MISGGELPENAPKTWNSMRVIREALGLPLGTDGIHEFLEFWDELKQDERVKLRTMDLTTLNRQALSIVPPSREPSNPI